MTAAGNTDFQSRMDSLREQLASRLPSSIADVCDPGLVEAFREASAAASAAEDVCSKAQAANSQAHKKKELKEKRPETKAAYEAAKCQADETLRAAKEIARSILSQLQQDGALLSASFLGGDEETSSSASITYTILHQADPVKLAKFGEENPEVIDAFTDFIDNNISLQRQMLEAGGPVAGNYGRCIQIYEEIKSTTTAAATCTTDNTVLQRLALAVALEFANDQYCVFDTKIKINPLQRYRHYQEAYLHGELDPDFPTFSVWELRMVVNSDGSNDDLAWGRQMVQTYRPDIAILNDPATMELRYVEIVRADVLHKNPDWYKCPALPKSYDQIFSGGGACGPRAWAGRFIAKAFGIPTWGIKQPGHAVCLY
jgi:hypothetical protein